MDFLAAMESVGVDSRTVLRRFSGMEMLWKKFVFRFPEDPTYSSLEQAVLKQEDEEIERQAHALKGVAANLGFDQLSQHANQIVQLVRQRPEGYRDMIKQEWEQLKAVYQKVLEAINCCKQ